MKSADTSIPNERLRRQRVVRGWTLQDVADKLYDLCLQDGGNRRTWGINADTVGRWERGKSHPCDIYRAKLRILFNASDEELGFFDGHSDRKMKEALSPQLREGTVLLGQQGAEASGSRREDWGEAPHVERFYGRDKELKQLRQWMVDDPCHLTAIVGMGGIGKTSLATALAHHIKDSFAFVLWRSLRNAPALKDLLRDCLQFFSHRRTDLPEPVNDQIVLLLECFREHRCLLVLDNAETVLQGGKEAGTAYREGFEGYGRLFQHVGEAQHQSCLLLTSREKPHEIALLEGITSPVRSYQLAGLAPMYGREILSDKGVYGEEKHWEALVTLYEGNPLSLKLVAQFIREVFDGDMASFLADGEALFSEVRDVLNQQFERLSALEREMIYWFAIEREAISLNDIGASCIHPVSRRELQEALRSLRRRGLVETSAAGITLQNVVMEFVTDRFIDRVCEEIRTGVFSLLESHPLIKAQAKDYVRESQVHLLLQPVVQRLLIKLNKDGMANILKGILSTQRQLDPPPSNYVAGNVLNLLIQQEYNLRGCDFSHLQIRQAYLQGVALPEVSFAYANLATSVFTDTFGSVISLAFHPGGSMLAVGTSNHEVRLWQFAGGIPVTTLQEHKDWVRSISFSPGGNTLVSSSNDQTIRLWDVGSGHCLKVLRGHINRVWSVAFSPDGEMIVSGGDDQVLRVWEVSSGQILKSLHGHTNRINSVAFSPQGSSIASGSEDQTVRLWETSSGRCLKVLQGHDGWIRATAFSPDGMVIASGGGDQTVRLWDVSSGRCLKVLPGHTGWVYSIAFSPDGSTIASGGGDQVIRVWNVNSGECLKVLQGHTGWVRSVMFSPDGNALASGSEDQTIRFWEASAGRCVKVLRGYSKRIHAVSLSCDEKIAASGGDDLCLWEVHSGRCLRMLSGHSSWIYSVVFSPDGRILASSSSDHTVRLWEASTGHCLKVLLGHNKCVWSIAFSPDGRILASSSNDQTVRLWEVSTGHCLRVLEGHTGWVYSVAFSPDGSMIASAGDDQVIRLWETSSGRCFKVLRGHMNRIWSVTMSPDGGILASGGDDQGARLWQASSGECLSMLQGHTGGIRSIAFSPDGGTLATGSEDQTVRLWDVSSGRCLIILKGHSSSVWSVTFGHCGNLVVSGSDDGTSKLWNIKTGACIRTLRSDRPYEHMNITGMTGVTEAQKTALRFLGAHEESSGA